MPPSAKPLIDALSGIPTDVPPIWLMRQAGRYLPEYRALRSRANSFLEFCYTPELAIEASLQPLHRFQLDAAIVFSDILVVPDALGQKVWFEEGRGPRLNPLSTAEDIAGLQRDGLCSRLAPVYDAVAGVREGLADHVALIGFAGAPWTIATYMIEGGTSRDHERIRTLAYDAPDLLDRLIAILTSAATEHLIAQVRAGAEVVQLFDSWAGALPATLRERYSLRPMTQIATDVRAACPEVPVIAFPRGVGSAYAEYAAVSAFSGVSIDQTVDVRWAAAALQGRTAVQGNLDPLVLAAGGAEMDDAVDEIVSTLGGGPFVFNLGHGVVPNTPPEHVAALIARVKGSGG